MRLLKRAKPRLVCRAYYFTMVEMLAVIAILLVLVGLSIGAYNGIQNSKARSVTEGNLSAIQGALEAFKTKHGYYPQTDGELLAVAICQGVPNTGKQTVSFAKSPDVLKSGHLIFGADFYSLLPSSLIKSAIADGQIKLGSTNHDVLIVPDGYKTSVVTRPDNIDSGSNPKIKVPVIYYKCPGDTNQASYDLFSAGHDRKYNATNAGHKDNQDNIWPANLKKVSNTK